jgi:hypothetical protein
VTTALWIFTGVVVAGTLGWNVLTFVKDTREAHRAREDFEKTRMAVEMREAKAKGKTKKGKTKAS